MELAALPKRLILNQALASLGSVAELDFSIDASLLTSELSEFAGDWKPYNPRKKIPREGLSLTSLDGAMSGVPDLDSLREYNTENQTAYGEESFRTPTRAFHQLKSLHPLLKTFEPELGRSHLLRFGKGGHFPPHRDAYWDGLTCFRILGLAEHCGRNEFVFMLNGERAQLQQGHVYFVDTRLEHSVFSFADDCTILVLNVLLTEAAIEKVMRAVKVK